MPTITLYTTAACPYCSLAKELLARRGVTAYTEIRVDQDLAERDAMVARAGRRTVPQIFIDERHVGGYDDLAAADCGGDLRAWLQAVPNSPT